jgi:hypothetical protein
MHPALGVGLGSSCAGGEVVAGHRMGEELGWASVA